MGEIQIKSLAWEASLLPGRVDVETHMEIVQEAVNALRAPRRGQRTDDRPRLDLRFSDVNPNDPRDYFEVVNQGDRDAFRVQIGRERVAYLHEVATSESDDVIGGHINRVAAPLIEALAVAKEGVLGRRILRAATAVVVHVIVPANAKSSERNRAFLLNGMLSGLEKSRELGKLRTHLPAGSLGRIGRIDMKLSVNVTVGGEDAELWLDLKCPGNDNFGYLHGIAVLNSPEGTIAGDAWAKNIKAIYVDVLRPAVLNGFFVELGERL